MIGSPPRQSDDMVVARSRREPEQFGEIFHRYFSEIYRYVAGRLGCDIADDLAAETFLIAFGTRNRFDGTAGGVRPWLYGIATNLVGRHRRAEYRRFRALARLSPDGPAGGHEERVAARVSAQDLSGRLAAAMSGLSDGDRDVLVLVACAGLAYAEVGQALGIPEGTVASRLNRARRKVAEALGGVDPLRDEERDHG